MSQPQNRRFLLRERPSGDFDPKILQRVVEPAPVPGPGQIRRIKVQGFIILDYIPRFPLAQLRMLWWLKRGRIKDRSTIVKGLDNAPQALTQLFRGENTGKLIVEIDEPPAG